MTITAIGPHRVRCGSVMETEGIDALMQGDRADFVYSDPPWGQGNLTYWQTINKRHTGASPQKIDYKAFMACFWGLLAVYAKDRVIIEYGQKWRGDVIAYAEKVGFQCGGVCTTRYKSGSQLLPCDVLLFSKSGDMQLTTRFRADAWNLRGADLPMAAFASYAPSAGIVLDPMCGMGYTANAALHHGLVFRGNELNAVRLEKTIARLKRGGGTT